MEASNHLLHSLKVCHSFRHYLNLKSQVFYLSSAVSFPLHFSSISASLVFPDPLLDSRSGSFDRFIAFLLIDSFIYYNILFDSTEKSNFNFSVLQEFISRD